ncbi:hypothetical protein GMLC_14920 [Geomonas limicola]|uniref:Uncharacterized protein n=1 Tax=Geomonas limicola TaxID=2740186 RepID=A0A6V8N8S3_9BACT|nr:hypothetical protein GMLC_14920 [Geomonas limicola]
MEGINKRGEVAGTGPQWACRKFGQPDHDYYDCPDCKRRFEVHLEVRATSLGDHQQRQGARA